MDSFKKCNEKEWQLSMNFQNNPFLKLKLKLQHNIIISISDINNIIIITHKKQFHFYDQHCLAHRTFKWWVKLLHFYHLIYLLMRMSSSNRLSLGLACSIKFKANLLTWQSSLGFWWENLIELSVEMFVFVYYYVRYWQGRANEREDYYQFNYQCV